jgi:RNA-directed DNA polymerase
VPAEHEPAARSPAASAQPDAAGLDRPLQVRCSSATLGYLRHYLWHQVIRWIGRKHRRTPWRQLRRRYSKGDGWPAHGSAVLFNPAAVHTERYRYRGQKIPRPWPNVT